MCWGSIGLSLPNLFCTFLSLPYLFGCSLSLISSTPFLSLPYLLQSPPSSSARDCNTPQRLTPSRSSPTRCSIVRPPPCGDALSPFCDATNPFPRRLAPDVLPAELFPTHSSINEVDPRLTQRGRDDRDEDDDDDNEEGQNIVLLILQSGDVRVVVFFRSGVVLFIFYLNCSLCLLWCFAIDLKLKLSHFSISVS